MPGSSRSALMLLSLFDLDLVEAGRTRRAKQADADNGLAGLLRNRKGAALLVPTGGTQKRADVQPCDLPAFVVVQRDGDIRLLIQILLPAHYIFRFHPARNFQLPDNAAVDREALQQV